MKYVVGKIVDRYVMVDELGAQTENNDNKTPVEATTIVNHHVARIAAEHSYVPKPAEPSRKRKRKLPQWLVDAPTVSLAARKQSPDGVFNYGSAVLNGGLLMMEIRDGLLLELLTRLSNVLDFMLCRILVSS